MKVLKEFLHRCWPIVVVSAANAVVALFCGYACVSFGLLNRAIEYFFFSTYGAATAAVDDNFFIRFNKVESIGFKKGMFFFSLCKYDMSRPFSNVIWQNSNHNYNKTKQQE